MEELERLFHPRGRVFCHFWTIARVRSGQTLVDSETGERFHLMPGMPTQPDFGKVIGQRAKILQAGGYAFLSQKLKTAWLNDMLNFFIRLENIRQV